MTAGNEGAQMVRPGIIWCCNSNRRWWLGGQRTEEIRFWSGVFVGTIEVGGKLMLENSYHTQDYIFGGKLFSGIVLPISLGRIHVVAECKDKTDQGKRVGNIGGAINSSFA